MPEGHPHCQNAWTNTTIIRYLIADNRAFGRIHDKPDIGFDAADFDIGFISSKHFSGSVVIVIYKRFHADGGSFAVVGNLLMGDGNPMDIFKGLCSFAEG